MANKADVLDGTLVAQSYKKIQIADFIVGLSRNINDKSGNVGKTYIIKNRFGQDGMAYPIKVDLNCGQITIINPNTKKGKNILQTVDSNNNGNMFKLQTLRHLAQSQMGDQYDLDII